MKINLIQLSLITSLVLISLNASNTIESITNWSKYPLPQEVTSKSKGGQLSDKVAMSDGVGSILIKSINGNNITLNNEQYNKLLLLNKDKLTDTVGLKELIASGDIIVDTSTLNSINSNGLSNPTGLPVDGTSCNDNNPLTINDIYSNNVCLGTSIVGTTCDDSNNVTINDVYDANGVCVGINLDEYDGQYNNSTLNAVPIMTSVNTPSGLGFSNDAYANNPINGGWTAFNLDANQAHSNSGFSNFEVGYIFTTPKLINKIMFLGQSGYLNRSIKNGQVLASNDTTNGFNGNWVILHTINKNLGDYINGQFTNFTYINTNQFKAYKIKWLTNFGSDYSVVAQLRFVEKQ